MQSLQLHFIPLTSIHTQWKSNTFHALSSLVNSDLRTCVTNRRKIYYNLWAEFKNKNKLQVCISSGMLRRLCVFTFCIHICALGRHFYPERLTLHYSLLLHLFPENWTHDNGVESAVFYCLSFRNVYLYLLVCGIFLALPSHIRNIAVSK